MGTVIEYTDQEMEGSYVVLGCEYCHEDTKFYEEPAHSPAVMYDLALGCQECGTQFLRWWS